MFAITLKWISHQEGGRRSPPPDGTYYATTRFPSDICTWSLVFELASPVAGVDGPVSSGHVRFLMENAPVDLLYQCRSFEVYEGPHKVAEASPAEPKV